MVMYAKISPKIVNPRDIAGDEEEEDIDSPAGTLGITVLVRFLCWKLCTHLKFQH